MARKKKSDDDIGVLTKPTGDDLARALDDAIRAKSEAADWSGQAGQHTKNFIDRFGYERKAFGFLSQLRRAEDGKRQALLRQVIEGAAALGYLDQADAFDDVAKILGEKLGVVPAAPKARKKVDGISGADLAGATGVKTDGLDGELGRDLGMH